MYLYYAVFDLEENGCHVSFPDLEGASTYGENMHDALYMAKNLLERWLIAAEDEGKSFPTPSKPVDILLTDEQLLAPIEANLKLAREKIKAKLVKKTVIIPQDLHTLAVENGINFSTTLTETLKKKLENRKQNYCRYTETHLY